MDQEQLLEILEGVTYRLGQAERDISELELGPSGTAGSVTGSGVNTQVAYWTGATVLAGDAGMTYNAALDTLHVGKAMVDPGLGLAAPDGTLHVHTASAGAVAAFYTDLVVETSGTGGISILTPAAEAGVLAFGSPTSPVQGGIAYDHASDRLAFVIDTAIDFGMGVNTFLVLTGSVIEMADDTWIGLGVAGGRIEFDDQATDEINFLDCIVGIGTSTPDETLHLLSSGSTDPTILMENTNGDALAPAFDFYKNSASPADNDDLGAWDFYGNTSTGAKERYAYFFVESLDVTNGDTGGGIDMRVVMNSIERSLLEIAGYNGSVNEGEVVINQDSQDVDFRVEGNTEDRLLVVDAGTDEVRLGDWDTNYTAFSKDGTLTMVGTARVEVEVELPLSGLGKGASAPTLVRIGSYIGYAFGIGDDGYFEFETPVDWDATTDIKIGIHWYCDENYAVDSGEVQWQGVYACTPEGGGEPIDAPTHTGTLTSGDVDIPAVAKHLDETYLTIPAASIAFHDIIGILVSRIALVGGNNPTARPTIVSAEVSYIADKLGEDIT